MTRDVEVLIVEDNPGDVVLFREATAKAGFPYRITVVRDGVDATDYMRGAGRHAGVMKPDLVVLDLKLPRRSGREVLGDIKSDPRMKPPFLVVLSSSVSELEIVRAGATEGLVCMAKPATFDGFVELVESIERLRRDAAQRAGNGKQ